MEENHAFEIVPLEPSQQEAAVSLLAEAFRDDPTLRWCFLDDRPLSYEERLRTYLEAGHEWHTNLGQPTMAAVEGGKLIGVLYAMEPGIEITEEILQPLHDRMVVECGPQSTERFFRYHVGMDGFCPPGAIHILALLAVRPTRLRQGVGTALVAWLCEQCDAHPESIGIGLDTALPENVEFYKRLGFDVVGENDLDGLTQQALFRPKK